MKDLKYIEINMDNLDLAVNIQNEIFPKESARNHYLETINKNVDYEKYYLVYNNDKVIGITGLYCKENIYETNSIWLGWFGVLPEYRRRGYGKNILLDTINMAINLSNKYPIKYFRLYTSERDDAIALPLYDKIMDIKEYYNNTDDCNYDGTCLIYSKGLNNNKVTKWNNKFINLKRIISMQSR